MAKSTSVRKLDVRQPSTSRDDVAAPAKERFADRPDRVRSANEITSVIGLKPIKGRSGPKLAY